MIYDVVFVILAVAAATSIAALVRGPSTAERVIALDLLLLVLAAGIAVWAVDRDQPSVLIVLVVVSLVAFAGTVVVARVIEARKDVQ